jgi:fumarate hydratase class II
MSNEMSVAAIILQQLGGAGRLKAMIGATDFCSFKDGNTLAFKFKMCPKANYIKISLEASDTYAIEFVKIGRLSKKTWDIPMKVTGQFSGIYAEDLKRVISDFTGLALSIGRVFVGGVCIGGGE